MTFSSVPPRARLDRIPSNVSLTSGALVEPLSVVLQGVRRSSLRAGESVLVLGAGAVGLLACAAAKASGASFVAAVDIDPGRLEFARENGWADKTYLLPKNAPPVPAPTPAGDSRARRAAEDTALIEAAKDSAKDLIDALLPLPKEGEPRDRVAEEQREGFDVTFECTGVMSCVQTAIFVSRLSTGARSGFDPDSDANLASLTRFYRAPVQAVV